MRNRLLMPCIIFFIVTFGPLQPAVGQNPAAPSDQSALQQQVDQLQRLVFELKQRIDAMTASHSERQSNLSGSVAQVQPSVVGQKLIEQNNAPEKPKEGAIVSAGPEGFFISNADKSYSLRIGAHMQVDGKTFYDNRAHLVSDSFIVRRLRPIFAGNVGKYAEFRFMPDFGNGTTLIYDAYADLKYQPYAVLRGGKFKTPLGLEQLQNDADLTFVERSLATDLVPNRDEGFEIYGDTAGRLSYTAAIINGAPVGQNIDGSNHSGKDVVGRIFATPWANSGPLALKRLGFGIAASSGRQDEGALLPTFKSTGGQATFFTYLATSAAAGNRVNYSPQLYYYDGPLGLLAEYAVSTQRVSGPGISKGAILNDAIAAHAWEVTGSWLLTGESKTFGRLTPRRGFEGNGIGSGRRPGAWELAARYSEFNIDPRVFALKFADPTKSAEAAREWTLGVNWYLSRNVKLVTNFEQTHFEGGAVTGNRPTEKALEERMQIAF